MSFERVLSGVLESHDKPPASLPCFKNSIASMTTLVISKKQEIAKNNGPFQTTHKRAIDPQHMTSMPQTPVPCKKKKRPLPHKTPSPLPPLPPSPNLMPTPSKPTSTLQTRYPRPKPTYRQKHTSQTLHPDSPPPSSTSRTSCAKTGGR